MTAPVSDGLAAVQARMQAIQVRLIALRPPARADGGGPRVDRGFDAALAGAMAASSERDAAAIGGRAVALAERYLGVPYQWGGTDPATGLDCSGLVQLVYRQLGIELPRVAADQARTGRPVATLAEARPGDLVFFGDPVDHVGIYAGNGRMIVAPRTGEVVKFQDITREPVAIRRVAPADEGPASVNGFDALFNSSGLRHGVDPRLLAAVARAESGFDARAVSPAGAQGLMQLMPSTAAGLGVDPMDPAQAVEGAARLLAGHLRQFGSLELALAAYNAGAGAVQRYGGVPPYAETEHYVRKVIADYRGSA